MSYPDWQTWLEAAREGAAPSVDAWEPFVEAAPLDALCEAADAVRRRLHPDDVVGYVIDRNVNYSNVCAVVCTFCAFYRRPGHDEGYVHSKEAIGEKVRETLELGGSGVLMQGGLHPDLPLEWYEELLAYLGEEYPEVYLHCFSPPELWYFHEHLGLPLEVVLTRLKAAGLRSIPGGGAEILVDAVRKQITTKCTGEQWLEVMRQAHRVGLPSTATMMFGIGETPRQRLEHLAMVHALQEETGGFLAFIPWTFQPDNTPLGRRFPERQPVEVYLRWLALSRLYLQNVPNIQVSWLTQGIPAGRRGLRSGANDMGSIMIEENVITPAGATHRAQERDLVGAIRAEGFIPRKRNAGYQWLEDAPPPEGRAAPSPDAIAC